MIEIEVTPEMIDAGAKATVGVAQGALIVDVVPIIYRAMHKVALEQAARELRADFLSRINSKGA